MSNDELQKAIDDITRDSAAPVSEEASAETEALVDEMVGEASQAGVGASRVDAKEYAGGFEASAPAPKVPEKPGMPPVAGEAIGVNVQTAEVRGGSAEGVGVSKFGGVSAPEGKFEDRRGEAVGTQVGDKPEDVAPVSAFSGVKVEAPEVEEKRDYGKEMDRESVLSDVTKEALRELYPLLDKVDVTANEKFEICMEAAEDTPEAISSALEAAKRIEDEKSRAEALLKIVKFK